MVTMLHTLTGLSKPTASQLLQRLEDSGLVRPSGFGDTGPGGRAPQLYRINPTAGYAAAVDVRRDLVRVRLLDITGAVVLSLGVDAAADDPESPLRVTADGYRSAAKQIAALGVPVVAVQEGGYHLPTLGRLVAAALEGLAG